ncbi:SAM hydrolase/SAM-dependent halogenase family protein [Hyalangium rubrum]|uniref:SAM-dependent chlorinase/fluorinase n=1 Tax=Hyalangium rubrum TaxID=3103134 RepID=A0ABU5HFD7_9BACT|nr:SAM-dependent chlorinase/fluorinase [Hyalangium sp. s54d21]MDY7231849.1 SAM-dependent chlorinase/fluorinase [Hyalangium sp. s54d21]
MPLVSLLTDFGVTDTYVGQMKAAILRVAPGATLVDLTHAVPAQDVRAGAFLLWTAVEVFPPGSLHLAIVDPGVGSSRRAVAVRSRRGDVLVGPDNGLLLPALEQLGGLALAVELTEVAYWGALRSRTFHGRDLFAPVAGHLASGVPLEKVGSRLERLEAPFRLPTPTAEDGCPVGEVVHVDSYGNLVTNLPGAQLPARFRVRVGLTVVEGAPHAHYQSVAPGELLALVGSAGLLELSARDGSAASVLGVDRGERVYIEPV